MKKLIWFITIVVLLFISLNLSAELDVKFGLFWIVPMILIVWWVRILSRITAVILDDELNN